MLLVFLSCCGHCCYCCSVEVRPQVYLLAGTKSTRRLVRSTTSDMIAGPSCCRLCLSCAGWCRFTCECRGLGMNEGTVASRACRCASCGIGLAGWLGQFVCTSVGTEVAGIWLKCLVFIQGVLVVVRPPFVNSTGCCRLTAGGNFSANRPPNTKTGGYDRTLRWFSRPRFSRRRVYAHRCTGLACLVLLLLRFDSLQVLVCILQE